MKRLLLLLLFSESIFFASAQHADRKVLDSLLSLYDPGKKDTQQIWILSGLSFTYDFKNPDSGLLFAKKQLELSQVIDFKKGEADAKKNLAIYWWTVGDYFTSIKLFTENLEYYKKQNDTPNLAGHYSMLGTVYRDQGDYETALTHKRTADKLNQLFYHDTKYIDSTEIGGIYYEQKKYDTALLYLEPDSNSLYGWGRMILAKTYTQLGKDGQALNNYRKCIEELKTINNYKDLTGAYISLAQLFSRMRVPDSSLHYSIQALQIAQENRFAKEALQSYLILSDLYDKTNPQLAYSYLRLAFAAKDSLYNQEKQRQILGYQFNEDINQQKIKNERTLYQNKLKTSVLVGVTGLFFIISILLYRNNRQKQTARLKIEKAYTELKSTQAQLIQSEKMASLGELTAGIAHEIQNPLNFVNNFSEVNSELVDELQHELKAGKINDALAISNNIKDNEGKINHHGKRADSIVKGMLEHSRTSTGQKELTDINKLADEYLRLAYHGLRAKDKSFNAKFETDFDPSIGKINVVPQDVGRVILNLITNAFYVIDEKKKKMGDGYEPMVSVSTKKINGKIEIKVADNGNGITQKVLDKIFQPFFTTKPTGQGTGLGLSLAYDIIKAHGGEIKVGTKEGEGSEFTIQLPVV